MAVIALHVGTPRTLVDAAGRPFESAIAKSAATGPITVGFEQLVGDAVFDRRHHGGPDRVVSAYPGEHHAHFGLAPGTIGENLTTTGLDEHGVCIGDIYQVGTAVIQVSMPRWPCAKIDRVTGKSGLLAMVMAEGKTGWLYRVITPGVISAPCDKTLIERPHPEWSVHRVFTLMKGARAGDASAINEGLPLATLAGLAAGWREAFSP